MFRKSLALMAAALGFNSEKKKQSTPLFVDDMRPYDNTSNRKGSRKFTKKASGAAKLQRAAKKRNNLRKRKEK